MVKNLLVTSILKVRKQVRKQVRKVRKQVRKVKNKVKKVKKQGKNLNISSQSVLIAWRYRCAILQKYRKVRVAAVLKAGNKIT